MFLFFQTVNAPPAPPAWYEDPITVATIVIAGSTVVYVVATILLWRETRDSVKITRETFENSLRPFIGVPELSVHNHTDKLELVFTLKVMNFGSIPAIEVRTSANILADGNTLPVQKHESGFLLIPPHSDILTIFTLDEADYQRAIKSARLDFRGSVQYEGISQKKYQYDFEGVYYPAKSLFVPTNAKSV